MFDENAVMRDARIRRHLTNIQGFSEILADPSWPLTTKNRLEYAEIVVASSMRLTEILAEDTVKLDRGL